MRSHCAPYTDVVYITLKICRENECEISEEEEYLALRNKELSRYNLESPVFSLQLTGCSSERMIDLTQISSVQSLEFSVLTKHKSHRMSPRSNQSNQY